MTPLPDIGPEKLDRLEALAKASTVGSWAEALTKVEMVVASHDHEDEMIIVCDTASDDFSDEQAAANAAFIAASDPPTVLALCAQSRRTLTAEGEAAALREALKPILEGLACNEKLYAHIGPDGQRREGVGDDTRLYAPAKVWRDLRRAAALLPTPDAGTGEER